MLDYETMLRAMAGPGLVVHAAAITGIDTVTWTRPYDGGQQTAKALRGAKEVGIAGRFVEFSTAEIFGSMAYRVPEENKAVAGSAGGA